MPFAAALSQHPVTAHAVGEVAGQVLEALGPEPDVVLLFVSHQHGGALEDAAGAVRAVLEPRVLAGAACGTVVAGEREVEHGPAVALWAGHVGPVLPVLLDASRIGPEEAVLTGWPEQLPFVPSALVLLADPFTFPAESLFQVLAERHPGLPAVGGMASAATGPGGNRLVLDGTVVTSGAVGLFLGPTVEVDPVVSQGCRAIGSPYTVTKAEQNRLDELGGRSALRRLLDLTETELLPEDIQAINRGGLKIGTVVDEQRVDFGPGDFLIRNVLGANREQGWILVGDLVEPGRTVQFHLQDADAADADLRTMLAGRSADAALIFTCNGRGSSMFGEPDHDASILVEALGSTAVAGMSAAGEFGPVAGRNFVHGFSASVALLRERRG